MNPNKRLIEEEFSRFERELAEASAKVNDVPELRQPSVPALPVPLPPPLTILPPPNVMQISNSNISNKALNGTNIFLPHFLPPHIQRQHRLAMQRKCIESRPILYNKSQRAAAEQQMNEAQPTMKERIEQLIRSDMEAVAKKQRAEKRKKRKFVRTAGGEVWEDETLQEWDPDDFRLFCGDLGNEVNDDTLANAFKCYPSFQRAKVIRDKRTGKAKGFGFVSFRDSNDFISAMREMNGKYVGNRPIKLRKSTWKDRNIEIVKKKIKEKAMFTHKPTQS
ncbi:hypothetical protein GJ496_000929 [Pomphorhynchus laevis]|nr:hypothetical protein GJ496_000929 [Pomphorhynchus laevis]